MTKWRLESENKKISNLVCRVQRCSSAGGLVRDSLLTAMFGSGLPCLTHKLTKAKIPIVFLRTSFLTMPPSPARQCQKEIKIQMLPTYRWGRRLVHSMRGAAFVTSFSSHLRAFLFASMENARLLSTRYKLCTKGFSLGLLL